MAGITLAKAIDVFAAKLGCSGDEENREFLIDKISIALEFMMINGGGNLLREWHIPVRRGVFTFPKDLLTPVKYKFFKYPSTAIGSFNVPSYSYSSQSIPENTFDYFKWNIPLEGKTNLVPTEFQVPKCGLRLIATTKDERDVGKKISVAGNWRGKQIAPTHNGFKTAGEILTVYLEGSEESVYGAWWIDDLTQVVRDKTCSYTMLSGVDERGEKYFLSHFHPDEEVPTYKQGELFDVPGFPGDCMLYVIGRIDPNIRYIRDEDVLPIYSYGLLELLAKRAKYDDTSDLDQVAAMEARITTMIKKSYAYKEEPQKFISINLAGSGATLTNI